MLYDDLLYLYHSHVENVIIKFINYFIIYMSSRWLRTVQNLRVVYLQYYLLTVTTIIVRVQKVKENREHPDSSTIHELFIWSYLVT